MSDAHFPLGVGPTIESLTQRHELFQLIQKSHLRWMNDTNDPNVRELHRTLADHFQVLGVARHVLDRGRLHLGRPVRPDRQRPKLFFGRVVVAEGCLARPGRHHFHERLVGAKPGEIFQ